MVQHDEALAGGLDDEHVFGEHEAAVDLGRLENRVGFGRKGRQRGAVVEEQSVLARADQQLTIVEAEDDREGFVANRRSAWQRLQRVPDEFIESGLWRDDVDPIAQPATIGQSATGP